MSTTTIVPYEGEPTAMSTALALVPQAADLADRLARTQVVPAAFKGKPDELLAVMLLGNELGLPPMASITKVHSIEGRASLSAEAMRAVVMSLGHALWIEEATNQKVKLGARRKGEEQISYSTWTMDDAKRAGLEGRANWRKYPKAMLLARATGELCRMVFPDVLAGISYTTEEVDDGFDAEVEDDDGVAAVGSRPADAPPAPADPPKTVKRSAKKATKKAAAKPAKPAPKAAAPADDPMAEFEHLEQVAAGTDEDVVDAELVEDDETTATTVGEDLAQEVEGRSYPPGQALAIRAAAVGLDEAARHGMNLAITGGESQSSNDLTREQIDVAFALLAGVEAGTVEVVEVDGAWVVIENGETVFLSTGEVDDEEELADGDGPPDTVEGWKGLAEVHGLRNTDLVRAAAAAASGLGEEPPANLTGLAEASLKLRTAVLVALRSSD